MSLEQRIVVLLISNSMKMEASTTEALLKIQAAKSGRKELGHPIGELESLTLRSEDNREEFPTATLVVATNKKATMIIIPVSIPSWARAQGPRRYGVC